MNSVLEETFESQRKESASDIHGDTYIAFYSFL